MARQKEFESPTFLLGDTKGNTSSIPYNTQKSPYVRGFLMLRFIMSENIIGNAIVPVNIGRTVYGKSVVLR